MTLQEEIHILQKEQATHWPLLKENLEGLKNARLKTFDFDGFQMKVQYNPKRIISSSAKVDKWSIEKRKCFLCKANRPTEQKGVVFQDSYEILCNPFPIFREHYTLVHTKHTPQQVENSFGHFLELSKALPEELCFYNAPNCGASAPDHLHFQAGNTGFLPIEKDYPELLKRYGRKLFSNHELSVFCVNDGLRTFISLESDKQEAVSRVFQKIYKQLNTVGEPGLNILSWYRQGWRVLIMLRGKHRPWQYFEKGDRNILLSPASVDMGGVLITPLEKDFDKITREDVRDIMNQVAFGEAEFSGFCLKLSNALA